MNAEVSIWERRELADPVNRIIERSREHGNYDLLLAQIPGLFGDSDKATYLGFRSIGFRPDQSMQLIGLNMQILELWHEETPELAEFELNHLPELQRTVGPDIIRLQFLRNMTLFLFQDSKIVGKSLNDFEQMTKREYDYLRSNRRFYTNSEFLNLQKAMEPEKHRANTLVLNFGNQGFRVVEDEDTGEANMEVIDVNADTDSDRI